MAAMSPEGPGETGNLPPSAPEQHRHSRYNYLVGRLRGRQITMEEATELFGLMQGMLRVSEAARRAAPPPPTRPRAAMEGGPTLSAPPAATSSSDDLFLVGLLAMGAGAGPLAVLSRRPTPDPPPSQESTEKGSTPRRSS
jgi:hypothetical protein